MRTNPNRPEIRPIDAVLTLTNPNLCCFASAHGFGYGFNSSAPGKCNRHPVMFIDNDYQHYDHVRHVDIVAKHRPKYATVLDVMDQRDLDKVLRFAEDAAQYAECVIVIPKVDCITDIPAQYVLGYAVPTNYGGTTLPYETFGNRRVHLLGGSWQQQRNLLLHSGMNIVSLDFNHCNKLARSGLFTDHNGFEYRLSSGLPNMSDNPYYTCMALSLAAIRAGLNKVERKLALRTIQPSA